MVFIFFSNIAGYLPTHGSEASEISNDLNGSYTNQTYSYKGRNAVVIFIMLDEKEHSIFSCRGIRGLLLKNIQRIFYWDSLFVRFLGLSLFR